MTAHIRFARAGERSALEELQRRASLMWEDHRAALLAHPDAIALPPEQIHRRQVRVAVSGNELLGFSVVLPRRLWAELDGLFVEPARMREGLGSRLVEDAARLARRRGARTLWVVANPNAEAFYRRAGFQLLRRTETRFGRGLRMRLALGA